MNDQTSEIIKPNDIEISNLDATYEKPSENQDAEQKIFPNEPSQNLDKFNENEKENSQNNPLKNPKIISKPFAPIPKRIAGMSLVLFIIGLSFLISGLVDYLEGDRERGIGFLVFGCLMFIPGFFYTYQIYLACVAGTPEERQEILDDIPQIEY